nr:MAG TPA: hypothetical protein [Caudoviricetes sp.]
MVLTHQPLNRLKLYNERNNERNNMDLEINRLLKLEQIPGFQMSEEEKNTLTEWKKNQKSVVKEDKEVQVSKGYEELDMGSEAGPVVRKVTAKNMAKVKNVVED